MCVARKIRGCTGVAECSGVLIYHVARPVLWVKDMAMRWRTFKYRRTVSARAIKLQYQTKTAESFRKTEERNKKDQERRVQRLLQKKRSRDEDGEVQDLAVLKRIKRAAEFYEKRAARLKQKEIVIPQWPTCNRFKNNYIIATYPSRA